MKVPEKGDWLYDHKESGQTLAQYKATDPVKITRDHFIIYLKPIGNFTELQMELLRSTEEYLKVFFQQKVSLLPIISDSIVPKKARRINAGNEQILAPYIMDSVLMGKIPEHGIALMAITSKDLFPKPDWNYIFGLASYVDRVGVSSIFRLQGRVLDTLNFTKCLTRMINVTSHEIGHMFSLHHCIIAKCVMNGSNSLLESDLTPNRLCSVCQEKLTWNFSYDNKKRLEELNRYFAKYKIVNDFELIQKDSIAIVLRSQR
jgi:archaemetzincin